MVLPAVAVETLVVVAAADAVGPEDWYMADVVTGRESRLILVGDEGSLDKRSPTSVKEKRSRAGDRLASAELVEEDSQVTLVGEADYNAEVEA